MLSYMRMNNIVPGNSAPKYLITMTLLYSKWKYGSVFARDESYGSEVSQA